MRRSGDRLAVWVMTINTVAWMTLTAALCFGLAAQKRNADELVRHNAMMKQFVEEWHARARMSDSLRIQRARMDSLFVPRARS